MDTTNELIRQLKTVKEQRRLSILDIQKTVGQTGEFISETTLRRVFAKDSETKDSFSFDKTIRPIANALLFTPVKDEDLRAENEGLKALIRVNSEQIERLREQMESIRLENDRHTAFLLEQIAKKDERMDRKDAIIQQLLERCFSAAPTAL